MILSDRRLTCQPGRLIGSAALAGLVSLADHHNGSGFGCQLLRAESLSIMHWLKAAPWLVSIDAFIMAWMAGHVKRFMISLAYLIDKKS